ncbi:MAG TPA: serine/threonine-protein kinase, partial [Vicinamibacterales bacterium]|nr:serine/threonine-protein kinase [Vicinamibacterales bacterium]
MSLASGVRLGPYEILTLVGAGGMGEVYRAHDTKLKRDVAVKVLPGKFARDTEHASRFAREAELLASLNHPNLAAIYTIDEHQGQPFIVMELLKGRTLKETIGAQSLSNGRILELAIQIVDGLDAAHSQGVIHRDIKPENIYVTEGGQAKILDFGLAKLMPTGGVPAAMTGAPTGLTEPGAVIGTVSYMSPEQVRGEAVDARTDLFSFGMVLYELTTGHQAFSGSVPGVVCDAILNRSPVPPLQLNPDVPPELQRIIVKLLEKDPRLRYQSAADLRADLQRLKRESDSGSRAPRTPTGGEEKKSIVVLPFGDVSATRDREYFADGLTDEIITDLSQLHRLRVISRNSSM